MGVEFKGLHPTGLWQNPGLVTALSKYLGGRYVCIQSCSLKYVLFSQCRSSGLPVWMNEWECVREWMKGDAECKAEEWLYMCGQRKV